MIIPASTVVTETCKQVAVCVVLALLPGAAISDELPDIAVRHYPLYDAAPHDSLIKATVTDPEGLLEEIAIHAVKGKVSDCTDLGKEPSIIPCRTRTVVAEPEVCKIGARGDPAECEMTIDIADGDMVTYVAVATLETGEKLRTTPITYSGGQPAVVVAMPVWWHSDACAVSLDADRLDVAFYPYDELLDDAATFSGQLTSIVQDSFFVEESIGRLYTKNRERFNIWAFPHAGAIPDFATCKHFFNPPSLKMDGLVDGSAILHQTSYRDCSYIAAEAAGTVDVRSSHNMETWLFVHESGHFLFGLADEYGDGKPAPLSDPPNTFATEDACKASPLYTGSAVCKQFGTAVTRYRIETDIPETMGRDQDFRSDFRNSSNQAVENHLADCAGGSC